NVVSAIKRQIPFLLLGTITGLIMSYFVGFVVTLIVNSIMWYLISLFVYKLVWKENGLRDQIAILKYVLSRLKLQKTMLTR
ncbi:MAG TPA: hypothetical protein VIP56_08935, partial [Nitrososphaeraceae archaeon]